MCFTKAMSSKWGAVVFSVPKKISVEMSQLALQNLSESLDLIKSTIEAILNKEAEFQKRIRSIPQEAGDLAVKECGVECIPALKLLNGRIQSNVYVLGANANVKLEQWGNTCLIVRKLLNGAAVDECMAEFGRLQEETPGR